MARRAWSLANGMVAVRNIDRYGDAHFLASVLLDITHQSAAFAPRCGSSIKQARLELDDSLVEVLTLSLKIEPHRGCGDHLHVAISKPAAAQIPSSRQRTM